LEWLMVMRLVKTTGLRSGWEREIEIRKNLATEICWATWWEKRKSCPWGR